MAGRAPVKAQWDIRTQDEQEEADFDAFIDAYAEATGLRLTDAGRPIPIKGTEDFVCLRSDGRRVGVELTQIRRSPEAAFYDSALRYQDEMDITDGLSEIGRLLMQKAENSPITLLNTIYYCL